MKRTVGFLAGILACASSIFAQQSPQEFLGYEIGTHFTRHHKIVDYFEHVAEASPLVEYHTYGETYEGRPLTYAVISSEENLNNLEAIRANHLQNAGVISGASGNSDKKAIVWLSYNVHGNEASSSEAAMLTLYELITSKKDWLENTVIIMDPVVNPDGRDRYVNWYKQVKATPYNTAPMAKEHMEPWPGGRPNHYLFDLNRDWAWATQVETRERLEVYNQWLPHVHVDFHEQGIDDPYYFAPAAEPFHEVITPFQREFQTEIGKNHARYFDEQGWLYFTKERFDLLYPSYGDTYPTYMGAIGMTYEQAGHGRAGLGIETSEGYVLTLVNRVAHHHTAGMSTIEIASGNVDRLNTEFKKFYTNSKSSHKNYALKGEPSKIKAVKDLLDRHEISYGMAKKGKVRGFDYTKGKNAEFSVDEKTLIVPTDQPKGKMVKVLFEPSTKLVDSLTYDITAWSLPYAYGLEAVATNQEIAGSNSISEDKITNTATPTGAGYITVWNGMKDARFLSALLQNGFKVRFTENAIRTAEKEFSAGSLVITKSDNRRKEGFDQQLVALADQYGQQLTSAATGFSMEGPDFGSSQVRIINKPRIGVVRGEETSSLNYGEIWYFFEQELNYPITSIGSSYFSDIDLSKLDILILPSGNYSEILKEDKLERLSGWIKNGGKIIALGSALDLFAGKEGFDLKKNEQAKKDSLQQGNLIPYAQRERESIKELITGSIVKTKVDNTHPLAFGYDDTYLSLKLSSDSYAYLNEGYNVAYLGEKPEIVAGFAGSDAKSGIGSSLVFGEHPMGQGSIIYMVDNPLFRGFWENGKLFFVNAIFFVNNDDYRLELTH
ncbi:Zinc carboxypeptidase [Salinimicrobium catena]|uniref:Zinc carboxypeptidase n=1 Tax=Salinimicrobium catena TaxID=390640 RepID=A0A1H5NX03_9FLAO|nr:M14 family metallopeptidase [Salinimicrobium catena]SDL61001.1 Zinc carboxypeptidase [Salinimicrobium catena]SEF05361.1 Zinc carboxypeptidase [Salinimicrobium catena]